MLKIVAICKLKRLTPLLESCCYCLSYLSSVSALITSTAVLKSITDAGLNLQAWSLTNTRTRNSRRGCNRGNAEAKRPLTITRFEHIQDGLGTVSSCAILLPDIDLTNDRLPASSQTRS